MSWWKLATAPMRLLAGSSTPTPTRSLGNSSQSVGSSTTGVLCQTAPRRCVRRSTRSEERRVGKEGRSRWWACAEKQKHNTDERQDERTTGKPVKLRLAKYRV